MYQKSKSLWIKLLLVLTIVCCALGVWFSLPASVKESKIAKAETVDITDTIDLQFDEGNSGMTAGADYSNGYTGKDDICLIGYVGDNVLLANRILSTGGTWASSSLSPNVVRDNGGVNIMEYIYINGKSISTLSAENASSRVYQGTKGQLASGGKYAPANVETSSTSGLIIRICMAYSNAGEFEIVIKEGFQLLTADGNTATVSEDVTFKYKDKAISKVVEGTDVTDNNITGISVKTEALMTGYTHFEFQLASSASTAPADGITSYWNDHPERADSNDGCDIMEYIYVNGVSARALSDENKSTGRYTGAGVSDSGFPLTAGGCYAPVAVEVWDSGIINVKVLNNFSAHQTCMVTFKSGFKFTNADGTVLTLTEDKAFGYLERSLRETTVTDITDSMTVEDWHTAEGDGYTYLKVNHAAPRSGRNWHSSSVDECIWYNGVDPLEYIVVTDSQGNSATARAIYANANSNIVVTTNSGGAVVKLNQSWVADGNFTITFMPGYRFYTGDNTAICLYDEVTYGFSESGNSSSWTKIEKAPSTQTLDDKISIGSWGAAEDGITWIEGSLSFVPASIDWDAANADQIAANNGVNPCDYVLINGKTASELNAQTSGTVQVRSYNWGENSYHFVLKVSTSYAALGAFTVQYKAGLTLTGADGTLYELQNDTAVYGWTNGNFGEVQLYTLTFEGVESKSVINGSAIGALPAVPEKDGYTAIGWEIDGVRISAETVYNYGADKTAVAVYEKVANVVDVTDTIWFTQDDWMSGNPADCITLSIRIYNDSKTAWRYEYVVADPSIKGCWNDNGANYAVTNGVDIMDYLYFNGESARSIVTKNQQGVTSYQGTTDPLHYGSVFAPIAVQTGGSWTSIKILKAWIVDNQFTITVKSGFELLLNDGNIITTTDDVSFKYADGTITKVQLYTLTFEGVESKSVINGSAIGTLPAVPEKDGYTAIGWEIDGVAITAETVYNYGADKTAVAIYAKDVTDTVSITNGSYKQAQSLFKIELIPSSALTSNGWWNIYGSKLIAANNGVDIMNYIYVNGQNIRTLSDNNRANNTYPVGSATGWLANSDQCRPVFVETNGEGIYVTVLHAFSGENYKITLKAGFAILTSDGEVSTITEDVSFSYNKGTIVKVEEYTLTFDGAGSKVVTSGEAIGELPAVPERSGYVGYWAIDGVRISAETVYSYAGNKTAVAAYAKDVTDTVTVKGANHSAVQSMFKIELIPSSALTSNAWWNIKGANLIAANNGVDIMNYIYVNGQNIRTLSDNNRANNTYPAGDATGWLTNSDQCRPVFVETNGEGIWVTVLHAFSGEEYTVTLKAGFAILTSDGETSMITEDVNVVVKASGASIIKEYVLSFAGTDETVTVIGGNAIGALPALPEVEGEIVLGWAIGGVLINEDTIYNFGKNETAELLYAERFTLTFDGTSDTMSVYSGMPIGEMPAVPENAGYVGYWTIDGVRISSNSIYNFKADKTAVAAYAKDITKTIYVDYHPEFAGASTEVVFVVQEESGKYLIPAEGVAGVWNFGYSDYQAANNGVDILEYIYINGESVRAAVTKNSNDNTYHGDAGWLANGGSCAPVFVEANATSGLFIRIYTGYSKEYFTITFKAGFSLINAEGATVSVENDVTYKFINQTVGKGDFTDADLDTLNGKPVTLMNGSETYLEKNSVRLTLPQLDSVIVEDGLSQVFVGWTTDTANLSDLYPAGYKYEPTSETGTTLYAVWIGFEMQYGAAVRLSVDSSGLRFLTDIDKDAYKLGVEKGLILEAGTFVVPTDYLYFGAEFVHSSFSKGQYVEKKTEIWKVQDEAESVWTYAAAFVNISEAQFSRIFSARGYLKINYTSGEGYIYTPYSEENNARSIYQVAAAAYDDYSTNALIQNYVNKVAEITWDDEHNFSATTGVKGNYSIESISADGTTFTVKIDGDVKSLLINGSRLVAGNGAHVKIGNFLYKFSDLTAVDGGYQFTVGAADELVGKVEEETLHFNSSDVDLDFFLNDFFKRHSGYTDENGYNMKVNSTIAGVSSEEFFSHEWMSMAYYWYNSDDGYAEDRIAGLRKFLSSVPVDDYGYVWSSNDKVLPNDATYDASIHRMGWPIPHAGTTRTVAWEFNGGSENWTSNISATSQDNLLTANVSGQSEKITFTSPSNIKSVGATSVNVTATRAPLMQIDIRIDDATNVEDIYVYYATGSSSSNLNNNKVSVKDKAFLSYDIGNTTGAYNHLIYLPMYAETAWGTGSTRIYQIKIEIALKSGTTISGNVGLNSVRLLADTRQSNNNSILISSLRQDYDFTGDLEYLTENITRARKAMNFLMQMYDASRKLNKQSYLVGHDGNKSGLFAYAQVSGSISNGYWDVMFMPEYDFQSNMYFYKAVADMAYLEGILATNGISVDKSLATVKTATRAGVHGTSAYTYDAGSLDTVANDVLSAMRANVGDKTSGGFWNSATGRFAAGYGANGNLYDYGYVAWNLEAIYYGIATDEQAEKIMAWLNSEEALYDFVFAPRSNTVADKEMLNGQWDASDNKWGFGDNVQYGGATMYTSFYDLMARIEYLGTDNAYERLQEIQAWYKEVYDCYMATEGANPNEFYRYYYAEKGITLQGAGTSGGLGLDAEFLESYLPLSSVAYGFFGIDSIDGKTLQIAPTLPTDLTYWGMENLAFNRVEYDLIAYKNGIQISSVRGDTAGLTLQIVLDYTAGQSVYVNGVKVSNPKVENGKVYVTVSMGATIVEVK